jgi:hypothetical protein
MNRRIGYTAALVESATRTCYRYNTPFSEELLKEVPRDFAFWLFMNGTNSQQNGHCYLLATAQLKIYPTRQAVYV